MQKHTRKHTHIKIHTHTHTHIHINNLETEVEGTLAVPLSIATTPTCKKGGYSIPWIAPLYP